MINGASRGSNQQIWVLCTSEQAPSAAAIPEAGRQAGARALRRCSREYERICVCVHHPELLGTVIHINEHLWLTGSTLVEMIFVFSHSIGVVQINRCVQTAF